MCSWCYQQANRLLYRKDQLQTIIIPTRGHPCFEIIFVVVDLQGSLLPVWEILLHTLKSLLNFTMPQATSVARTYKTTFYQHRHILMLQRDSSDTGNMLKKLKHGFIITVCWDIHWSVQLLFKQAQTSVDISVWSESAYERLIPLQNVATSTVNVTEWAPKKIRNSILKRNSHLGAIFH